MNTRYVVSTDDYDSIPGSPIAYWLSDKEKSAFRNGKSLAEYADCCTGMQTGDNSKYIRLWHEVEHSNTQLISPFGKWYRYNCGGECRKWYGNNLNLVNWNNNGAEIRKEKSSVIRNEKYYFIKGITWKRISSGSFSFRYLPEGFIFDQAGDSMFAKKSTDLFYILAYVNSKVAYTLSECISPTLNLTAGNMVKLPVVDASDRANDIIKIAKECVDICKEDWDAFEVSWDFKKHPLL